MSETRKDAYERVMERVNAHQVAAERGHNALHWVEVAIERLGNDAPQDEVLSALTIARAELRNARATHPEAPNDD